MLNVNVIVIGKLKESYLRDACAEYCKRLQAFCRIQVIELAEYRLPDKPSESQIIAGMEQEAKLILQKAKGVVVPLCIEGKEISSVEFASFFENQALSGVSEISFVIGGSFGLAPEVKALGKFKMSMSKMTFPHQLARVMLLEQIYRAFSIQVNTRYHK